MAGLASSIFLSLTGWLLSRFSWRPVLVILAIVYGLTAVPLHALVIWRGHRPKRQPSERRCGVALSAFCAAMAVISPLPLVARLFGVLGQRPPGHHRPATQVGGVGDRGSPVRRPDHRNPAAWA
ncbi:hypothetical protein [Herbidospora sp. RD11066]